MATANMANLPRVSGPKTEIWRKGSKIGFLLKDHIKCKLLTNELLKPVLVRMVWINDAVRGEIADHLPSTELRKEAAILSL